MSDDSQLGPPTMGDGEDAERRAAAYGEAAVPSGPHAAPVFRFVRWWIAPTRVPRIFVYYAIAVAFIGLPRGVENWIKWLS